MLAAFSRTPVFSEYLRRKILRRSLDPALTMSLFDSGSVDWAAVLAGLGALRTPEERVAKTRDILANRPDDPMGRGILVKVLFEAGLNEEAMAEALRLRRDGLASPMVLEILCDLQALTKQEEEAMRTCSEMVEFNADRPDARQRLGDLFLRHGWYEAAYRQYDTLVSMLKQSATSLLRLAAAAAGMGKLDEALRIERKVGSGDGESGPDDPRRFARLHSAARIAEMLLAARSKNQKEKAEILDRNLKRSQVFSNPATIAILVWEDFEIPLSLNPTFEKKPFAVSDQIISEATGLIMIDLGEAPPPELEISVETVNSSFTREVPYTLVILKWNGKEYTVEVEKATAARPGKAA
jgi:tetratricopeptide (TPR) repeat protein